MNSELTIGCHVGTHNFLKGHAVYVCYLMRFRGPKERMEAKEGVVDNYIATILAYPDAFTTAKLCWPLGTCKYVIKKFTDLVDMILISFLVDHVNQD